MGITALERFPQRDCRISAFGIFEDMARQNHNKCWQQSHFKQEVRLEIARGLFLSVLF